MASEAKIGLWTVQSPRCARAETSGSEGTIRTFRFDYECEIEIEYD